MNKEGRICLSGAISVYNDEKPTMVPSFIQYMIYNVCDMFFIIIHLYFGVLNEVELVFSQIYNISIVLIFSKSKWKD